MTITTAIILGIFLAQPADKSDARRPTSGRITKSTRLEPEVFHMADPENDGALVIAGDDIIVDFQGATLVGAADGVAADKYIGRGIVVQGRNITIKNAVVRGYKVGIYAEDSPGLRLIGCDVSRNYRQRLKSTLEREHLSDWLYGHENDDNQWLRYGAGIYLYNCPEAVVSRCRSRNGQNGICLVRCDNAHVVDNDMSFMSGWGLAMWRSSRCDVMNNRFDWCVRGYSNGAYSRGQDSAGILVYEQCNENVFAFNSATHGGDGFFLYAGNETVRKTGRGGCNGNLIYRNDFSHAAANGIEATFSKGNRFIENILDECDHAVWAGYSYHTLIRGNTISNCRNGISIEHGRFNTITDNLIDNTEQGVHLWWDDDKDLLASAFGKMHDRCPSKTNVVGGNRFTRVKTGIRLANDTDSRIGRNHFEDVETVLETTGRTARVQTDLSEYLQVRVKSESAEAVAFAPTVKLPNEALQSLTLEERSRITAKRGRQKAFLLKDALRGKEYIFVDEWGPYDFTDARAFPTRVVGGGQAIVQMLGPMGTPFQIAAVSGDVEVQPESSLLPRTIRVTARDNGYHPFILRAYAGKTALKVTGSLFRADWSVAYHVWSPPDDPRSPLTWHRILSGKPLHTETVQDIDFIWKWDGPTEDGPRDHFATVASTAVKLPAGRWRVWTVSDDGVRVMIDGSTVLENWTQHGPTFNEAVVELKAGPHAFHIEHFEIDGYAQLLFRLERVD